MIGKSLANDLQYTKLEYKQYLYFRLNMPLMFLLCFFLFSLFLSLCFFFVYLNFYLMYYQDNNTEHHKAVYAPYSRNCQVLQKKRKQTKKTFLFLATKRLCSVHITGRHYSLLVIQISSRSQISSRQTNFQQKSCQFELQICQWRNLSCIAKIAIHKKQHH